MPTGKTLTIRWQRLVDEEGRTCDRCGATGAEVEAAFRKLAIALEDLGVGVTLETEVLSPSDFSKDPLQSNRIWIGGKPIETWLSARAGKSRCCSACGDSDCRTITVGDKSYETIPSELIIQAGLLAGAELTGEAPNRPCCPDSGAKPAEPEPSRPRARGKKRRPSTGTRATRSGPARKT